MKEFELYLLIGLFNGLNDIPAGHMWSFDEPDRSTEDCLAKQDLVIPITFINFVLTFFTFSLILFFKIFDVFV